jgi:minor fimbrial subunit
MKNVNPLIKCSMLAILVMAVGHKMALADPVSINITGNVVSSPCVVNNNNNDLAVNLGTSIQAYTLATAGAGTTPATFNLALTSCPVGTGSVKVTFTGTSDATQPTMYANTGDAGPLAVELSQQGTGTILGNTSTLTQTVQADRTVTYALSARAVTATGLATPGSIVAVVQANFTYN